MKRDDAERVIERVLRGSGAPHAQFLVRDIAAALVDAGLIPSEQDELRMALGRSER